MTSKIQVGEIRVWIGEIADPEWQRNIFRISDELPFDIRYEYVTWICGGYADLDYILENSRPYTKLERLLTEAGHDE